MPDQELTEEDIMNNDIDPLDALREIRREEGVAEEDLIVASDNHATGVLEPTEDEQETAADAKELETAKGEAPEDEKSADEITADETAATADAAIEAANKAANKANNVDDEGNKLPVDEKTDDTDKVKASEEDTETKETEGSANYKFKANGQEFEFTQEEILAQFETVFGQSMNYTQKMQKIAPYRKMISALEQEGVTHDNLNLALDALKGDKGAIKKLLENNKIDAYDLTSEDEEAKPYVPGNYGKNETQLEIEEITSKISGDDEFKITTNVIDEQWDNASRTKIADNPNMIIGLHNDIKSGLYDTVAPRAMKMKVLDGHSKSDIEYYMIAGGQLAREMAAQEKTEDGQKEVDELNKDAQGADSKFDKASSEAERKRAASSTGTRADRKGVIDYLDDDDVAYDEWYKGVHAQL